MSASAVARGSKTAARGATRSRFGRLAIVRGALGAFAVALVGKAAHVQLWQGAMWEARASRQHYLASPLPAPRGAILDATGATITESRELVQLRVAPREVRDRRVLARALARAGVAAEWVRRATDVRRAWVELPGRFLPSDVAAAVALRGVYAAPVAERVLASTAGMRRIVGRVAEDGAPVDGVELALDSVLRGERGTATVLRDARGRSFESPTAPGVAPRAGNTVVLTINQALQDICERALADAVERMSADGGDVVVMDPHTGAVLAMASKRPDPRTTAATALSEPYEPGSTLKPFIAAKLLELRRARPDEVVNTHDGTWVLDGRTITDSHKAPSMTLTEVIMNSSNIGIVQFAQRLSPREEFEALRDAGLGTPTGVPYPAEAGGTLREPKRWSRTSPASLAMGYEVAVTPLQLVTAYASIANGGELLEPALVKEIRSPEGEVLFRHRRRVVRRVMPPEVARTVRGMLVETVAKGSAVEADLSTFEVAGKTGTAWRTAGGRGYVANKYTASFVGLFPSEDPQYVILVKLDNPVGAYYGGKTAAPVSKVVLEAAIAARDAALDRGALASRVRARAASESAAA
ncbi:MAG: peptidoglycan D,D-transpeptidase FtsI family protein, partial [Gemmatimonadaceae bacterium]